MSKNKKLDRLLESEDFKLFLRTARSFCRYIEKGKGKNKRFIKKIQFYLVDLYKYAMLIEPIDVKYDFKKSSMTTYDNYMKIVNLIMPRLPVEYYWEVHDPYDEKKHEPVCGSLSDDIADIYGDIKKELNNFDIGTIEAQEHAVFILRLMFMSHWGDHLTSALKALHWYLNETKD